MLSLNSHHPMLINALNVVKKYLVAVYMQLPYEVSIG